MANHTVADVEVGGDVVGRYSGQYETSVDPFARFRVKEREQRRKQMGIADRYMHGGARGEGEGGHPTQPPNPCTPPMCTTSCTRSMYPTQPTHRAMFLFGQLINSSKLARTMVFFYTLMLHALVFFMMMHTAHKTPAQSMALCGDYCLRIQQQQMQVAGNAGGGAAASGGGGNGTATRGLLGAAGDLW